MQMQCCTLSKVGVDLNPEVGVSAHRNADLEPSPLEAITIAKYIVCKLKPVMMELICVVFGSITQVLLTLTCFGSIELVPSELQLIALRSI